MNIRSYTFEEYIEQIRRFHGFAAPGVAIGGFMVELAYQHLGEGKLLDAICETTKCLPDAIQLLTPCTVGNSWLRIINTGRYALTLYDKHNGEGVRVFLDPLKLERWPEIKSWFFKLKSEEEQEYPLLMEQIKEAGTSICRLQQVKVSPHLLKKQPRAGFAICPRCKEAYPITDGEICLGCREDPYFISSEAHSRAK